MDFDQTLFLLLTLENFQICRLFGSVMAPVFPWFGIRFAPRKEPWDLSERSEIHVSQLIRGKFFSTKK